MRKTEKLIKSELDYEKKIKDLTVRIKNPEAMEASCNNFTKVMIKLYNEGRLNIPQTHNTKSEAI